MAAAKNPKIEDQGKPATAALYATRSQREGQPKNQYPLDEDNKLSSAGAATSLKYASPRDLPSYPIAGLANMDSSAGAAASLANANQKSFEHWKPNPSASANKAAQMAKDFKPAPLWHPGASAAGSKAAALATRDGGHVNIWRPEATEAGNSAAGQAMRAKGLSPQVDYGYTADGSNKALLAATGAMAGSRKRSGSTPVVRNLYPDSENSAANALSAATFANKPSIGSGHPRTEPSPSLSLSRIDAARIHNAALTNLSREMFTSHPPVAPEVDEKNRQAGLRAAAVSMAKQMYDLQQKAIEQARESDRSDSQSAATFLHNRRPSIASTDESYQSPPQYANLQEAAQKLAAERLAKLHDEHSAYRNYYGTNAAPQSRLSIRNRPRRRASSDGQVDESDESRSQQIRSEMSLFNQKLTQVDAKKRQHDREFLMAAAQRNVRASMHGIDKKVYAETGKASPAMMDDWEAKANARAKADSDARMVNYGRVDIGGGKFLNQSEVDAIAAKRVQPTLDEITRKAETQRAREEQLRLEEQQQNEIAAAKTAEDKERNLKTKQEWKRFKEEEKQEAKAKKDGEKARRAEERRLRDEEKRKLKGEAIIHDKVLENLVAAPESPAIDPKPDLEPMPIEEPRPASVSPKLLSSEEFSNDEPATSELASAEQQHTRKVFIEYPGQTGIPGARNNDETSLVKEDIQSDEPLNRDEGPNPVLQRTVSTVDPALLDPALREHATGDEARSETNPVVIGEPVDSTGLSQAELTAMRVFSAPVEANTPKVDIGSPSLVPNAESGSTMEAMALDEELKELKAATPTDSVAMSPKLAKHNDPLANRIAPLILETTISGPSTTPKSPKGESKVSSWLKTKFSRRASKPAKPEISDPIKGKSSNFIASGPSDSPNTAHPDQNQDGPSTRDIALVENEQLNPEKGKTFEGEPYGTNQSGKQKPESNSSSAVSCSSGEGARGRTGLRREGTSSSHGEDFEEARDHFDTEKLTPPAALRDFGRGSDSPVRDSRFQEDL